VDSIYESSSTAKLASTWSSLTAAATFIGHEN
jgi:hypothetical protein